MQPYKPLIVKLLILLIADTLLLAIFVWWIDATPDVAIGEMLMVPALVVFNLIAALVSRFIVKRKDFTQPLIINAIIAPIIFHWLFKLWFIYYDNTHFKQYTFALSGKQYELLLDKRDTSYSFMERLKSGSAIEFKQGHYIESEDYIELIDSSAHMRIFNNELLNYPSTGKQVQLNGK
jgi:hypothetical protein